MIPSFGITETLARCPGTLVDLSLSVLRIETTLETPADVLLRFTGKISEEHLVMLERLLSKRSSRPRVGLDLGAVMLADRGAVELLALRACRGVVLKRCPAFLREWIRRETEQHTHLRTTVVPGSLEPRAITDRA